MLGFPLGQRLTVTRQSGSYVDSVWVPAQSVVDFTGVITSYSPTSFIRLPEGLERTSNMLKLRTSFQLFTVNSKDRLQGSQAPVVDGVQTIGPDFHPGIPAQNAPDIVQVPGSQWSLVEWDVYDADSAPSQPGFGFTHRRHRDYILAERRPLPNG